MKAPKMLRTAASAFGLARRADDVETIEAAIIAARAAIADGEREESEAQGRYRDALLADDGDPASALDRMQAAKIKRDRGEAQAAALTIRLGEVRETAEQARRREIYTDAEAKAEAAQVALRQDYPAIARQVLALLHTLADAESAIVVANTSLPADAVALVSPELRVRHPAYAPREADAATEVELWAPFGGGDPLPEADQGKVRVTGEAEWKGHLARDGGPPLEVHRRTFRRIVTHDLPADWYEGNLAGGISLPGLHPFTLPFWRPELIAGQATDRSPEATLAALADVEPLAAPVWRPVGAFFVRVRFEEISRHREVETVPHYGLKGDGPAITGSGRVRYGSAPSEVVAVEAAGGRA